MNHFHYRANEQYCEDVPLSAIADEVGTPTYVYSQATLTRHYQVFDAALSGMKHRVCYSVKANSNVAVLSLLRKLGAGADVVSGGELVRALRAGISGRDIVFSGVGKTANEMRYGMEAGILSFHVESLPELELLNEVAKSMNAMAPVSLRINPNVDPKTHPYISTGLKENKFGIPWTEARQTYQRTRGLTNIEVLGIDCHIGSQLTETGPFVDAARTVVELVARLADEDGFALKHIDVGGGLGIPYLEPGETEPPTPALYGQELVAALKPLNDRGMELICEPGRAIAGNAGVLLTRVLYRKDTGAKRFVIVDGAFNDLMRPALYDAYHSISPVVQHEGREQIVADIVGPICETGDFLGKDRQLSEVLPQELLSIGAAGAYGFTMASNYNSRVRPAEVLVRGDRFFVIRARETLEQLLENERIPDWD